MRSLLVLTFQLLLLATVIAATTVRELPRQTILVGLDRPLRLGATTAARLPKRIGDNKVAAAMAVPLRDVSTRSIVLRTNVTVSQSRIVLSRLDQLALLSQLVDAIDLAPRLADASAKVSAGARIVKAEAAPEMARVEPSDERTTARGFLFVLDDARAADADVDVAIVRVGSMKLGFGWRYPLAYWTQLSATERPTCAFAKAAGQFYYC